MYLLLVLTSIVEVSPLSGSRFTSISQMKKDLDISLDTCTVRLLSQLPFRSSQDGDRVHFVRCTHSTGPGSRLTSSRFSGCWTTLVTGTYLFLFLHPKLSKTPITSIGVQGIWICLTWILWIVATAYLNAALPFMTVKSRCSLVYCGQLKALFGKRLHVSCEK